MGESGEGDGGSGGLRVAALPHRLKSGRRTLRRDILPKGAIDSFTVGLAKEVAAEGIRVNAVRPGIIDTDIHASGGLPDRAREMAPQVPMQRPGSAEEVARSILWLMSPESSYTTGTVLDVTGGR